MRLYCLSGHPNRPCFILKFKSVTIMLDCGLDTTSLLSFLPIPVVPSQKLSKLSNWVAKGDKEVKLAAKELKENGGRVFIDSPPEFYIPEIDMTDLSEVDVILISNSNCMMSLPYITQHSGFKGVVYATEPTLQVGRQYMEELVEYITRVPKTYTATKWKQPNVNKHLPAPLSDVPNPLSWKTCYTKQQVDDSLAKVQMVGFGQKIDIFGAVTVTAISSGYRMGSSNWVIKSDYEKICYLSGSSTLTTHPKPLDQAPLKNSDLIIMSSLTQVPTSNPDSMIGEFCISTALTLKNGGNVLVPVYPSGVTFDLFECLSGHLDNMNLGNIPMYFISPVSDSSIAYSNIFAEWLSSRKQSRVYLPEYPFPHTELISQGKLQHYKTIHGELSKNYRTPCVVFTGHPSLRFGDVVHFLELWGKSSSNTIIFTEPDFSYLDALAPFQPLNMKVLYYPIDTSLNFSQANKLLKELKPQHVVVSEKYITPPPMLNRPDLIIESEHAPIPYKRFDVLSLPIRRTTEKIELEMELTGSLIPTELKPGVAVAMVSGVLAVQDNNYILQSPTSSNIGRKRKLELDSKPYMWGDINVSAFVDNLSKQGITDIKVEDSPTGGRIVHLTDDDILIQLEEGSTHIICDSDESLRTKIRDALVKCLNRL
ncbi:unnamed protein product [Owenia fusiformis]|uniref:Uncharacterized protein n=1 Tax=Owenia fusiformis TaxID=6347 RepID=A0A8J1TRY9_OWEFU|nr:unnamed protein product [Owenia fusiformis]